MRTSLAMLIVLAATMPVIAAENVERPAAARDDQQQTQQKPTEPQDSSAPIGTTSSTHNPHPSSTRPTGLNRRDGETGTNTSTHNPPK
jgi:hypothetical protein